MSDISMREATVTLAYEMKRDRPILSLVIRKMWQIRLGVFGGLIFLCLVVTAVFSPLLAPYDPLETNLPDRLLPPVWMEGGDSRYLLGTDHLGRDSLSRIIYGSRVSLLVGISAVILQVFIGVLLGMVAGYYGKKVDSIISFFINAMLSFPFILFAMTLVAVLGPSLMNIIIALGATGWTYFARVARIETMRIKEQEFILAAKSLAFRTGRILLCHILPNLVSSIVVLGTVRVAQSIILETILSFLGLGIQPPTPSWGNMLAEGRDHMLLQWWLATLPGCAIFMAALGINLMGDALRDLMDPHLRKS